MVKSNRHEWYDMIMNPLLITLLVALVINFVMFLIAFRFKTDKLTDVSYGLTFVAIVLYGLVTNSQTDYSLALFGMITIWAFRLGGFLLFRIRKMGRDRRFDGMRENFVAFGRFWLLQAITVWVILIPSSFAFASERPFVSDLILLGIVVWAAGLVIESQADMQKYRFNQNPKNKGKWIEEGIWRYSRHPNYFGEILVWVGLYLYVFPGLTGFQPLVGLISPLFITALLLFVSGVPILEKSADKKWGKLKDYQAYKRTTHLVIPLPRNKG